MKIFIILIPALFGASCREQATNSNREVPSNTSELSKSDSHGKRSSLEGTDRFNSILELIGSAEAKDNEIESGIHQLAIAFADLLKKEDFSPDEVSVNRKSAYDALPTLINYLDTSSKQDAYRVLTTLQTDCPPPVSDTWRLWLNSKKHWSDVSWSFQDNNTKSTK